MSSPASPTPVRRPDLVIGVDGGASHTVALVAEAATGAVLGRGTAGPSNIQAVGEAAGLRELDAAVVRAFEAADTPRAKVAAACLGLAGIDVTEGQDEIRRWADAADLAGRLSVANDATLLFAAGTPEGWGLAVIAGTGSIAFTLDRAGRDGRAGGWGYLLGDEGSAFQIALAALRAACRAADGCLEPTVLVERFLNRMGLAAPIEIITAVYRGDWDRAAIASLAPEVLDAAAGGDSLASRIVSRQADELALTAATALKKLGLPLADVPVALTGGLLLQSDRYRELFLNGLRGNDVTPGRVQLVDDPALGAVVLARRRVAGSVEPAKI